MSTKVPVYVDETELDKVRKALDEAGCGYLVEVTPRRPRDPAPNEQQGTPAPEKKKPN